MTIDQALELRDLRADHTRLTTALRVIAAATATDLYPFCKWCGFEIGDVSQTPGHAHECPSAIARAALSAEAGDTASALGRIEDLEIERRRLLSLVGEARKKAISVLADTGWTQSMTRRHLRSILAALDAAIDGRAAGSAEAGDTDGD